MPIKNLYIHYPFCIKKCNYCDFTSFTSLDLQDEYVSLLCDEIDIYSKTRTSEIKPLETLFIGGGTPSLITMQNLVKIIKSIEQVFIINKNTEFTIEANPGTITLSKLKDFRNFGVNRLSIGVQSFDNAHLKFLNRIHTAKQAIESIELAHNAGFENISLDLLYSIPNQTIQTLEESLFQAIHLNTHHISAYSLIYEQGTPLFNQLIDKQFSVHSEEVDEEFFLFTSSYLQSNGFEHYEISNFARPRFQSKHNINYWLVNNYISFGISAHSFIGDKRYWNYKSYSLYKQAIDNNLLPIENFEILSSENLFDEMLMLGLRASGISLDSLNEKQKLSESFLKKIDELIYNKLAEKYNSKIKLTTKGYLLSDYIIAELSRI